MVIAFIDFPANVGSLLGAAATPVRDAFVIFLGNIFGALGAMPGGIEHLLPWLL